MSGTLNVTDLSATNIYTVDLSASQIFTTDLSATNLDVSGTLNVTDLSATNIYTVDLSASQIFTTDLSATNIDVSDLSATNIYTVDLSASQIFTTDLSATNIDVSDLSATNIYTVDLSASQIFTTDLSATNIDVSDLSATNIYTVDLSASQIFTTDLSATNIDVSGVLRIGECPIDVSNGAITLDCSLNLSCNPIVDVSSISFCDGTYIGHGESFDISTNETFKIKVQDSSNAFVVDQSGNILIGTSESFTTGPSKYMYFPGTTPSGEVGPYISLGDDTNNNPAYQVSINLLTDGSFNKQPSFSNTNRGWHIVAKGHSKSESSNMLKFNFKDAASGYIQAFNIAGKSADASGGEIGIGADPLPGVCLYIDPSSTGGGAEQRTQGGIRIGPSDTSGGQLQFVGHNANIQGFQTSSDPSNVIWTLPISDGTTNQVLETDGNGQLSWRDLSNISFNDISVNDISCTDLDVSNNLNIGGDYFYELR